MCLLCATSVRFDLVKSPELTLCGWLSYTPSIKCFLKKEKKSDWDDSEHGHDIDSDGHAVFLKSKLVYEDYEGSTVIDGEKTH